VTLRFVLATPLAVCILTASLVAAAQSGKVPRIGYLLTTPLDSPETRAELEAFRTGLHERGYVVGQSIIIEFRSADGDIERFRDLAAELVRLRVDLIIAPNTPAARAAQHATTTIPIVAPRMGDPVGDGLVVSLARPGGNITGLTFLGPELSPKRLEILKEAVPRVSRVAVLWHPGAFAEQTTRTMFKETEAVARTLGVHLQRVEVRGPGELDRAFAAMTRARADAVIVFPSPMLFSQRKRVVELAAAHRLPSISNAREYAALGGLIAYGASITDLTRRAATYVDRILKGAKPSDLPVERPEKFELVVNVKTARALGLALPPSLLRRADHVIE